ncbi:MAG: amino acid adenylation domain-containing protein, partial [Ginsengibacter sp.]
ILTIQVVSRARHAGYELQSKDMFLHQSISKLSLAIADRSAITLTGEQGLLTGAANLLPIQQGYFERKSGNVSHFNQSVLLKINKDVSDEILNEALEKLLGQHDALRLRFTKLNGEWEQEYGDQKTNVVVENIESGSNGQLAYLIKETSDKYQQELDIEKGELIKAVLMHTAETESHNRLLIVIHHLAIDGVSWRILIEDMERILNGIYAKEQVSLGYKTSSYRQWYKALEAYGKKEKTLSQKKYWQKAINNYSPLPTDKSYKGFVKVKDTTKYFNKLTVEQTDLMLHDVPRAYHTEINDLLLSSLAKTLCDWTNTNKITIGLEGHGREEIGDGIDISRTVGWFTTLYPLSLEVNAQQPGNLIKSVKEQLRSVPDKGVGYGVLKYINKEDFLQGDTQPWDILFNYLGQADNVVRESKWFTETNESAGAEHNEELEVNEQISINSIIRGGELSLSWTYSGLLYEEATIAQLATNYIANLQLLITDCLSQQKIGAIYTPSDYGLGTQIHYQELDKFLDEKLSSGVARRYQIDGLYSLSGLQQGMLFHNLYGETTAYTIQLSCIFRNLNVDFFRKSWNSVLKSHTILRSAFYYDKFDIPVQCVYKNVEVPFQQYDYRNLSSSEQLIALKEHEVTEQGKGFDFEEAPLMRITLIRLDEERYWMLWTHHHIILDGWSRPVLMEEFLSNYKALLAGKTLEEREEDRYEDYIRYIERKDEAEQKNYWKSYLQDLESPTLLPFIENSADRNKGAGEYKSVFLDIDTATTANIKNYVQNIRVTANTLIQGVWSYLLSCYTGSNDILFGVTSSGRPDDLPGVEQRVGLYINPLPLHAKITNDQKLEEWLKILQQGQVSSRQFQNTPLSKIQEWSSMEGDLFDCLLTFENYPIGKLIESSNWGLEVEDIETYEKNNYPLTIVVDFGEKLNIRFRYNSTLLTQDYIDMIVKHFENVLLQFIKNPDQKLADINLLTRGEDNELKLYGESHVTYPRDKTIVTLFETQAVTTPNACAIIYEGGELSYKELNERSNQLANHLRSNGVQAETLVPLMVERSAGMIIGILGILKAGGAYVPVDADYPAERISYMLEDTGAKVVVSSKQNKSKLEAIVKEGDIVIIDIAADVIREEETVNLEIKISPNNLAYVIYTSGSTGKPKGVMIEHQAVVDHCYGLIQRAGLQDSKSFALFAPLVFDAGQAIIFSSLFLGASLQVLSKEQITDGEKLSKYLEHYPVDCIKIVPSVWLSYAGEDNRVLAEKVMIFGGESFSGKIPGYLKKLNYQGKVYNHYGPTEATIGKTIHEVDLQKNYITVPIGKPFSNTRLYIADSNHQLVPAGVAGELYIAGEGLARGYLNQPELTKEKFIKNPFEVKTGDLASNPPLEGREAAISRAYKTGDKVKWNQEGEIEYLGRIDEQVKIRGHRIELGEIENVLVQIEGIREAAVTTIEDSQGNKQLAGYIVVKEGFDKQKMQEQLREKLPGYMLPGIWVEIEQMPLTANGKINKKALPKPEAGDTGSAEYVAPKNETEEKLSAIWQELLGIEKIGTQDNFFELGGHSLLAMRLISAIRRQLDMEVPVKSLFLYPTIAQLGNYLQTNTDALLPEIEVKARPTRIPLSFSQERLWFIDQLEGSVQYHLPTVLRLKGKLDKQALSHVLQQVLNRHEVLRTVFREEDGQSWQNIKEEREEDNQLQVTDGTKYKNDKEGLSKYIQQLIKTPFDLSQDNMLRVTLIELGEEDAEENSVLVATMHHIASDAWSTAILVKEVVELYNAYIENRTANLAQMHLQYADYSIWQRSYLKGELLDKKINYWREKLGSVAALQLPTDYTRPAVQSTRGSSAKFKIDKALSDQLYKLSKQEGTTLFITMQAVYKALLYRYSGQSD